MFIYIREEDIIFIIGLISFNFMDVTCCSAINMKPKCPAPSEFMIYVHYIDRCKYQVQSHTRYKLNGVMFGEFIDFSILIKVNINKILLNSNTKFIKCVF